MTDAARGVPGARIDWVVEEGFAGVARMHARVERVIPVAVRRWRGALWKRSVWNEIAAFRAALAAERYDAVIDTQGLLKSALIAAVRNGDAARDGPCQRARAARGALLRRARIRCRAACTRWSATGA